MESLMGLPENAKYEDINKIFLEKSHRIEEGADRNKLIRYFLNDNHYLPKELVIQQMLTDFYWYEAQRKENEQQEVEDLLTNNKDFILKECRQVDLEDRGIISWKYFAPIIHKIRVLPLVVMFELQCKCFSYDKSLHSICYKELVNDIKSK